MGSQGYGDSALRKLGKGLSNAGDLGKSIAEARKQASAMHGLAESALQNPETKQVQCMDLPELHCGARKTSKCNARARQECIAEARNQASAMHGLAGSALQKIEKAGSNA